MKPFRIEDLLVEPGTRGYTRLGVGHLVGGYQLSLPLHVVHGSRPGPTLLLVGVVHGEEIFAIDVIRHALAELDATTLHGTVLAVPVANPPALASQTRNGPLDMLDLNRQFPGSDGGWLSERIAARLASLVDLSDCLLHIDGGSAERVIHYTFVKTATGSGGEESERLSRAFGLKLLYRGPQAHGSLTSYAAEIGLPCVLAEIGGGVLYGDPRFMRRATAGVRGVLTALGMISGDLPDACEQLMLTRRTLMRVPEGGIFHPSVGVEAIERELRGDTLLGTIVDPYSLEQVAEMRAPYPRSVLLQFRTLPTAVQPGEYAYIVADLDSAIPA